MLSPERFRDVHFRHVQRRQFEGPFSWRRLLEDQPFVLIRMPRRFFDFFVHLLHKSISDSALFTVQTYSGFERMFFTAAANRSISARGVVSVTHTRPCLDSSGYAVPNASGPAIFSFSNSPLMMRTDRANLLCLAASSAQSPPARIAPG